MPRVEIIQYDDVPKDGLIDEGALVPVKGMIATSTPDGGCGLAGCPCVRGHFVMRLFPGITTVVSGAMWWNLKAGKSLSLQAPRSYRFLLAAR
ncbi:hypothetical protein CA603_26330 [Paraburkholderia hospita]|nr:hypothetical protein CA603_26330 [Paraburkholderia hospita]